MKLWLVKPCWIKFKWITKEVRERKRFIVFEKKEYIVSSTFGVCMVEKVTKLVVGREQQMEYYVLQSARDRSKKSYIPVENHETVLRLPMTEEKAKEMLENMVINGKQNVEETSLTVAEAKELLESGEPEKWAYGAIFYLKNKDRMDSQLEDVTGKIWENLSGELEFVLKKTQEDIRQILDNQLQ